MKNSVQNLTLLGAHVSIAGGISKAPERGAQLGCNAIQIFTKNQRQWQVPDLEISEIQKYKSELKHNQIRAACVHDSYLINLGSSEAELLEKSRAAFPDEMQRAVQLRIPCLVFHPGNYKEGDEKTCLRVIAESLDYCLERLNDGKIKLLLETTAGQGTSVGYRFEQLAEIRNRVKQPEHVGYCLDTSHIFAAGYDIRNERAYEKTMAEFDEIAGLENLHVIHLNDSKKPLGSRIDRHENIGLGEIGLEAFRLIMNDPRLLSVLKILETPGGDDWYLKNMELLKSLIRA